MAEIDSQPLLANIGSNKRLLYESLRQGDTSKPFATGEYSDGSIQAIGNFSGSASINLQGSNDGNNWFNLTDDQGSDINLTSAGGKMFLPRVWKIRARVANGNGSTDIDVYILLGT